jgi:CheY-like chemotaxis protein
VEPNLELISVDHWLEELLSDFADSFQNDGKAMHFYPAQPVGQVLVNLEVLDKLMRSILANLRLFAYDTHAIDISLRREKAVFQILIEHAGDPVPAPLKEQILRTMPADLSVKSPHGLPAPDELLMSWAHALGGHYTITVTEGSGISYVIQIPLRLPRNQPAETYVLTNTVPADTTIYPQGWNDVRFANAHHILVVEDNAGFRDLLKMNLKDNNYVLDFAENGLQGLEKVRQNRYDVIISDVMMPEMNGFAFAEAVRALDHLSEVPFLFLTSLNSTRDLIRGIAAGADAYLTKPVRIEMLKAHIFALLVRAAGIKKMRAAIADSSTLTARVDDLMYKHLGNPDFSIDSLTTLLGLSRSAFYRVWAETGEEPVNTRLLKMRLKFAVEMLQSGDFSIAQIASASGFSDPAYFAKAFKKVHGVLPSKYK